MFYVLLEYFFGYFVLKKLPYYIISLHAQRCHDCTHAQYFFGFAQLSQVLFLIGHPSTNTQHTHTAICLPGGIVGHPAQPRLIAESVC